MFGETTNILIAIVVFVAITRGFLTNSAMREITKMFKCTQYLVAFLIVVVWCIYVFTQDSFNVSGTSFHLQRLKKATSYGLLALVIAMSAKANLTLTAFWGALLIAYVFHAEL